MLEDLRRHTHTSSIQSQWRFMGRGGGARACCRLCSPVSLSHDVDWIPSLVLICPGADLFSNCTEECKALGHSDRCWMPSFMPSDGRQGPDYRSNLHVPGMDSVPDTEVFECPEKTADKSFSTFGKETPLRQQHLHPHQNHHHLLKSPHLRRFQGSIERKELETFLPSARAPYKPAFLSEYCVGSTRPAL